MAVKQREFGRIPLRDERDDQYPMVSVIRMVAPDQTPARTIWTPGEVFDQEDVPAAVGFAWRSWLACQPISSQAEPWPPGTEMYRAARQRDGIDGRHDGTTIRAGAQLLADPSEIMARDGHPAIMRYVWAQSVEDIRLYVLLHGPVVMGTRWLEGMLKPDKEGFLTVAGDEVGQHAWLIHGFDSTAGAFLARLSWGKRWGVNGDAWIRMADVTRLLAEGGEACTGVGEQFVVASKSDSILEGS